MPKRESGTLTSVNPRTGETVARVEPSSAADVDEAVELARDAQPEWARLSPRARAAMLGEVRHRIHDKTDEIVATVAAETGKPEVEALAHEVLVSIALLQSIEILAPKVLRTKQSRVISRPVLQQLLAMSTHKTEWRPFGVVGAITPWNYPITNCFLAFASALAAGNTVVVKPSEATPACGDLVRDLLTPLPPGVATVIQGGPSIGAALVDAPCDKISFIGSTATARTVCATAAKHLTPVVLELGGKDAAIVCRDADVDVASSGIVWGGFFNAGQTCCSIERVYVVESIADEVIEQLLKKLEIVGRSEVGPLSHMSQFRIVKQQIDDAVKKGARLWQRTQPSGTFSTWITPAILEEVDSTMSVFSDETFGPVITVSRVHDETEAVRRANEEAPNLTASIWTQSSERAREIAGRVRAGNISINQHAESTASAHGSWGGMGESGFGRLTGEAGIREFTVSTYVQKSWSQTKRVPWFPYDDPTIATLRGAATMLGASSRRERLRGGAEALRNARRAVRNKL